MIRNELLCIGRAFVPGRKQKGRAGAQFSCNFYQKRDRFFFLRKIMDGRSINKINGETCTVGQMKAAAECLLDIHGQHEHQSLLYQEKQLEILGRIWKRKDTSGKGSGQDSPMRNTANICGL